MTADQLYHGIRACCQVLNVKEVYVVGSQSILASYPKLSGPVSKSNEMDVLPILGEEELAIMTDQIAADIINGNIGEGSDFQITHGFEVEGVVENDLVLAPGWRDRTIPVTNQSTNGFTGHCLEPYDMAVAKIAAGRDKDRIAVSNLIRQGILKPTLLKQRVETLSGSQLFDNSTVEDLVSRLKRWSLLAAPNRAIREKNPPPI